MSDIRLSSSNILEGDEDRRHKNICEGCEKQYAPAMVVVRGGVQVGQAYFDRKRL